MHNFDFKLTEQQIERIRTYTPEDLDVRRFSDLITAVQNGYMISKNCLKNQSTELLNSHTTDQG